MWCVKRLFTSTEGEVGEVATDLHGNAKFSVVIGSVPCGTYQTEFFARNGAGVFFVNGGRCSDTPPADFQSPGPTFGESTPITVP